MHSRNNILPAMNFLVVVGRVNLEYFSWNGATKDMVYFITCIQFFNFFIKVIYDGLYIYIGL